MSADVPSSSSSQLSQQPTMTHLQPPETEKYELSPYGSSETLTNPSPPQSKQASRESSTERPQKGEMKSLPVQPKTVHRFLEQELDIAWTGNVIIVCFFTSGLIDAVAFNSWNCFVGMQTGNTVFAALGIGGQPTASHFQQYYKSLVSIGSFCMGTLFFNALHRWPTGLRNQPTRRPRWIFSVSFVIQTALIIIAAILVTLGLVSNQPFVAGTFSSGSHTAAASADIDDDGSPNYLDLCPIAILAFEAAGQVCLSRVLSLIELPTIVLSTLYHDFTGDLYGTWAAWERSTSVSNFIFEQQRRQLKRLMSIIALFAGGIVGGEMYKSSVGMAGALWLAAGLKLLISVAWIFWKRDPTEEDVPR